MVAPALWAISNHFDKYLLSKYIKQGGTGALIIFSSLIGLLISLLIVIFKPAVFAISMSNALMLIAGGILYILAILLYLYALHKDETSIVVPLWQLIPVFSYILAYFVLGERLTPLQIVGSVLIIAGSIFISLELKSGSIKLKHGVFWHMALASLLIALYFLFFKFVALDQGYWTSSFWSYIGYFIVGIFFLLFVPKYRREFSSVLKNNALAVIGLNGINEIVNVSANLIFTYATLLAPLALVTVVSGVQPMIVFLYGLGLTIFFPKIVQESLTRQRIAHKLIAISIIFVGVYLINS